MKSTEIEDGGLRIAIFYSRSSILDFVYYPNTQYSILPNRLFEAPDGIDVVRRTSEPRFHGIDT